MAQLEPDVDPDGRFTGILVVNLFARSSDRGKLVGLMIALSLGTALVGCGRPPAPGSSEKVAAPSPTPAPMEAPPGETPSAIPVGTVPALTRLAGETGNPYLINNARAALTAWNQRDYDQAVVYAKTALNLRLNPDQQAAVVAALEGMREELDRAAQGGNASAKAALSRLGAL